MAEGEEYVFRPEFLRKVTRLLKYLRDIKATFTCPSVLLTTLVGYRIDWMAKDSADFADVPTTLKTLVGRLDDWLQQRPDKPVVTNPKLVTEDFGELWETQDKYANFRNVIHRYRGWNDEAFAMEGRQESIAAWQRVFGDEFGKASVIKVAADAASEGLARARNFLSSTAALSTNWSTWSRTTAFRFCRWTPAVLPT